MTSSLKAHSVISTVSWPWLATISYLCVVLCEADTHWSLNQTLNCYFQFNWPFLWTYSKQSIPASGKALTLLTGQQGCKRFVTTIPKSGLYK